MHTFTPCGINNHRNLPVNGYLGALASLTAFGCFLSAPFADASFFFLRLAGALGCSMASSSFFGSFSLDVSAGLCLVFVLVFLESIVLFFCFVKIGVGRGCERLNLCFSFFFFFVVVSIQRVKRYQLSNDVCCGS